MKSFKQYIIEEIKRVTPEEAARIRAEKQGKPLQSPIRASAPGGKVWLTSNEYQEQKRQRRGRAATAALMRQKEQGKVEHPGIADLKQIWLDLGRPAVSGAPIIRGRSRANTGISFKDQSSEGWVDQPRQQYGNIHWGGMSQAIREMHARGEIPEDKLDSARKAIMQNHLLYYTGFAPDDHKKYYIKSNYDPRNFGERKNAVDLGISVTSNNRVNRGEYEPLIAGLDPLHKDFEENALGIRRALRQNNTEVQTPENIN
jgi:hypothetical protein